MRGRFAGASVRFFSFLLQAGQLPQLTHGEKAADNGGSAVRNGACVHDAVNAHKEREDDDERQQEQNLACQGHEYAEARLADRVEEVGGDRLDAVDQRQEHINAEVPLRKLVVHLAAGAENTDDLPRKKLEAGKRCQRKPGSHSQRQQIALFDAAVERSTVIEADDRLYALRNADDKGHKDHVDL